MKKNYRKCISLSNIDTLTIGACNNSNYIEDIIDTFVKIKVSTIKVIEGKCNNYVYITGCKIIKLHYVTNDCTGLVRSTSFVEPFNAHFCVDACANDLCIVNYSTKLLSKDYEVVCDDALYFSTFFEICIKFNKDIDLPEKCFYDSIHSVK